MKQFSSPSPLQAHRSQLTGIAVVPGDKSISHRALILGALAIGRTRIANLLHSEDIQSTIRALRSFGAQIGEDNACCIIDGFGTGGFAEPDDVIDCGNSGTGARLLMGALCTSPITATFTGDASLRSRPMSRVIEPAGLFGAACHGRTDGRLPLTMIGARSPVPIRYTTPVPSAQVKSAVLLAGLNAPGRTMVIEHTMTRDHTERMLKAFGATLHQEAVDDAFQIEVEGHADLEAADIRVPADPSSAAFPVVAALITGSEVTVPNVGINPTRTGLFEILTEMGADISFANQREECGEPVADILVRPSSLRGLEVPPAIAATMIDEYPVLAVAAACSDGATSMRGIGELRHKESDRIDAMCRGLIDCGVKASQTEDSLKVHGRGMDGVAGDARCATRLDHRIAMSFLCLGLAARQPISIDDAAPIRSSFPSFRSMMEGLGANLSDL